MPRLPTGYQTFINWDLDAKETVLAAPGTLFGYDCYNDSQGSLFLHFYDALIADVTVGTTVAKITVGMTALRPARLEIAGGIVFATGITVAATTDPEGSTEPGANEMVANVFYLNTTRRQGA